MTVTPLLGLLAQEGGKAGLWNPTIIGVLTVLSAVGLFCGSVYLLLGTNLGGRLGFLVAIAGLSGFLVLLTTLWLTTPGSATGNSDLDPPHGPLASWKVVEILPSPSSSKIATVRTIAQKGHTFTGDQCASKEPPKLCDVLTSVKPPIDSALGTCRAGRGPDPAGAAARHDQRDRGLDRLPARASPAPPRISSAVPTRTSSGTTRSTQWLSSASRGRTPRVTT